MRATLIIFILIVAVVLTSGCAHTPANVAAEVPMVLDNVSHEISAMETPNVTLESVMKPLQTSADYIKPIIVPVPTVPEPVMDPIIGSWQYVGDAPYNCNAQFGIDSQASASCSAAGISFIQRSFTWNTEPNIYTWMRNYTIMDISDNQNYSLAYSERTGRLTSEILPGTGYLVKVS